MGYSIGRYIKQYRSKVRRTRGINVHVNICSHHIVYMYISEKNTDIYIKHGILNCCLVNMRIRNCSFKFSSLGGTSRPRFFSRPINTNTKLCCHI